MKKRIFALIMCVAMLFSMVGCAGNEEDELNAIAGGKSQSDNAPMEITLYVPSVSKLTPETREAVEKALNAISVKKFNTTVRFFAYPEEEYVPIVLTKVQNEMASYFTYLNQLDPECGETSVNYDYYGDINLADMTNYPELAGQGIDIFVSFVADDTSELNNPESPYYNPYASKNMFLMMYEQRVLEALTPRFVNDYAILKSKSYTEFFDQVTMTDMDADPEKIDVAKKYAYAMPNNYVVGQYKFLVVNKAVVSEAYSQDFSMLSDPVKLNFLKTHLEDLKNLNNEVINSVDHTYIEFDSYEAYKASTDTFALAMVTGDLGLPSVVANSNYEIVQYSASEYDSKECAKSMYCITRAYSEAKLENAGIDEDMRINRCLDILLLIQNDADFRNTLQYGVKGEHYNVARDGTVYTSSNDYVMDPTRIGNMFLLYPSDRMNDSMRKLAENNWSLAKKQNNEILGSKPSN